MSGEEEPVSFSVLRGNPTSAELAAVTAVVTAMVVDSGTQPAAVVRRNAWERSARALRREIVPGFGAWNSEKF